MPLLRRTTRAMKAHGTTPGRLLITSFLGIILAGTLLLKLPVSTPDEAPIGWIDALFTATSATCVTGLVVRDTGADFTPFGQFVILLLIQAGGLGIMSFSLLVLTLFRSRVPLAHRAIYEQTLGGPGEMLPLVRLVFVFTFATEALGAAALFPRFLARMSVGEAAWAAVFHAISAFCNAGFGLWPDSLVRYQGDAMVNAVVMLLIILGGLGFFVVFDLIENHGRWRRLTVHSKLALTVTAVLIAVGAAFFWILETHHVLLGMPLGEQILASLFQSVTTRTAGFNTVEIGVLAPPTLFMMSILMFIGGSPGSCAGGIKTTTLGILMVTMRTRLRGHQFVNVFRRSLSRDTVGNTLAIALGGVLLVVLALFALLLSELPVRTVAHEEAVFIALFFETISALGTVGLSTGITPALEPASRVLVSILMFVGRLGPLTVATALALRDRSSDWRLPEEDVMVG